MLGLEFFLQLQLAQKLHLIMDITNLDTLIHAALSQGLDICNGLYARLPSKTVIDSMQV